MLTPFRNEPFTDFSAEANIQAMRSAINRVKAQLGQTYPLIIGGEQIFTDDTSTSINPGRPQEVIGSFAKATVDHADQAIETAARAFESWRFVAPAERAGYLFKAAAVMRRRKFELAALNR
jgi:1-pyrroline-5-carboxylate dehydrogenase